MQLNAAEIYRQIIELDEHPRLEAKLGTQIGPSILETVCALANEPGLGGGFILLGIRENRKTLFDVTFDVVDLANTDQLQNDLTTQCATVFNHRIWPRVNADTLQGKRVLTVFVPEAAASQKPIYFKDRGLPHGAFRRSGSGDVACIDEDMAIFYMDRQRETFDYSFVAGAEIADINSAEISHYRELRRKEHPEAEELEYTDSDLLVALGCAKFDGGELRPTVAGILLFGTSFALRRWFPMMRVDYIRVPGRTWMKDPDKRYTAIEIRAPLLRAIQRARAAILDDVMKDFSLLEGELQRQDISPIPDKVVREIVVNAVMHRCYKVDGPIQIIRYANRLEVRNPGYSLKSPELFLEPGSQSRNPKIAAVLHELNIAETKGSGIRVMQRKMREVNLSPPFLESNRDGNQFLSFLLLQHFLRPEVLDWLSNFKHLNLTDDEAKALFFARGLRVIDNSSYRSQTDTDAFEASRSLRRLCELGLLVPKGIGQHTYYVPTPYLLNPSQSGKLAAKSGKLAPKSGELEEEDGKPETPDIQLVLLPLPDDLQRLVDSIPPKATERRMTRAILRLCQWRPLKASEIGEYLDRNSDYIRDRYLGKLLETGHLAMDKVAKTDPNIRYLTTASGKRWLSNVETPHKSNPANNDDGAPSTAGA